MDKARDWFQRALAEARRFNNWSHVANVTANLGLVAKAAGQVTEARRLLGEAQTMAKDTPHLRERIESRLSEVD